MRGAPQEERFSDYTLRNGLRSCYGKMNRGEATTVAFLGGSVTAGEGASDAEGTSYRALVCAYLRERFPGTPFTFVNAAIGGTDSVYGAFRLNAHVFGGGGADLLVVEFAVNDDGNRTKSVRAMEGIVRQAKRINPLVDILFVYTANRKAAESFAETGKPQINIAHHEEAAVHYGLPSVDIASRIYRMIAAGNLRWEEISGDSVHPNDYGYSLYAQYLREVMDDMLRSDGGEGTAVPLRSELLDPMCYDRARLKEPLLAERVSGCRMVYDWTNEQACNWTPPANIFLAERAGASFRLRFVGTAAGIVMLAGMETGDVEYSIDGGPYLLRRVFDSHCEKFYRPKAVLLADGLADGPHWLDVRAAESKDARSKGNRLHLTHFLVNGNE
ncbi:SGNH/GDSL hydrolase family protein [Cohnella fermenti]|nr:SGNH/GDSL hydrolase family protein [Cohnella fermenti]